tara:strand:- start:32 stop:214 length:183 start_codon:yes stop_codon:yes gene_type:complete
MIEGWYMDMVAEIMRYESGEMTVEEVVEFFQRLLTTGAVYHLQGSYQRTAQSLIEQGLIG